MESVQRPVVEVFLDEAGYTGPDLINRDQPAFVLAARAHALFTGPYPVTSPVRSYDVSSDGQRFIMTKSVAEPAKAPNTIQIVLNWTEELKRLVPTK